MSSHAEAERYIAELGKGVRALAAAVHEIFVELGCTTYVKTICVGYDVNGEMVAASYPHADHVEIRHRPPGRR